jgi:hypothetical protein
MLTIIGPNGFERVNSIVSYRGRTQSESTRSIKGGDAKISASGEEYTVHKLDTSAQLDIHANFLHSYNQPALYHLGDGGGRSGIR